ncbi:hypothetical protein HD806DRAFT_323393 [Xylariaceae sp. AK1471]|nr:hypothetical protein HD806DRAFT_323393 [Xylariaceae sp. AK1471]
MPRTLPSFAPFPEAPWRDHIVPVEWEACLSAWLALAEAYLSLPEHDLIRHIKHDESIASFQVFFIKEIAASGTTIIGSSQTAALLLRQCFLLCSRLLRLPSPPPRLLTWEFLSDFSRVYGKKNAGSPVEAASQKPDTETSLQALKKSLILSLDSGIKGDLTILEMRLKRLNHLIHASPNVAAFFLAGTDFLDGLVSCFKIMNPPLRKAIITTTYLCLIGLTEGDSPKYSTLADQLYSLKSAADAHKTGHLNANDSMVVELVTVTPILKQIRHRLEHSDTGFTRSKPVITALEAYRKPGASVRPKRLTKRKIDKGKGIMTEEELDLPGEMRVHRMSQVSQIQDLFPDLGSGFISKLLDEYGDNTEQVIAHLLEDSLPLHLAGADRTRELSPERTRRKSHDIAPRSTPPQIPTRHNVFDDDELDRLDIDVSNLHFGKRNPGRTTDDLLNDRSTAPNKAAILSALSAFDADDDERDDTYDAADAGFVVNDGHQSDADDLKRKDAIEEALFRAYQANPKSFDRDAATRRSDERTKLKQLTGMTDEAIEGWAVMLTRTPHQMRQLETKYSAFGGGQPALTSTAWRANPAGSGPEDSDADFSGPSSRGSYGRGRGRGRGGGRGGNVAGPTGDKETENARKRKEANKGSRANHNRRDQRAKKMGRGAFPG